MRKLSLFISFLLSATIGLNAQAVVMDENVAADTIPPTWGPNRRSYTHLFVGYGFVTGNVEGAGASIRYGNSSDFNAGIRHKRKVAGFYDVGFDLYYGLTSFNMQQDSGKIFPTPFLFENEKVNINHFGLGLFNRLNFGRRGDLIKYFVDIGAWGQWEFMTKHIYLQRHPTQNFPFASQTRVANRGLEYINNINYGLMARVGVRRFSLYGTYRISDVIKNSYQAQPFGFPEMPRFIFGLQFGLHG
jgi:hypothetical protein